MRRVRWLLVCAVLGLMLVVVAGVSVAAAPAGRLSAQGSSVPPPVEPDPQRVAEAERTLKGPTRGRSSLAKRTASRSSFRGLKSGAAADLAQRQFGLQKRSPLASLAAPGERVVRRLSDHLAVVRGGGVSSLKLSTLPNQVRSIGGKMTEPSLDLVDEGDELTPEAPVAPLTIARQAQAGTRLGDGVAMRPESDGASASAIVTKGAAFFANTQPDTDYAVKPVALGAEAFWQLRSPLSPERLELKFSLPPDAVLRMDPDFPQAAEIVKGDGDHIMILPPTAVDADGVALPVSMTADGDVLRLTVAHREESVRYPILVDPAVFTRSYGNFNG